MAVAGSGGGTSSHGGVDGDGNGGINDNEHTSCTTVSSAVNNQLKFST